jgi:hypothetical protein
VEHQEVERPEPPEPSDDNGPHDDRLAGQQTVRDIAQTRSCEQVLGHDDENVEFRQRCLLLRAAALHELVNGGEMGAGEAIERLTPAFAAMTCTCCRLMLRAMQRADQERRQRALDQWRRSAPKGRAL